MIERGWLSSNNMLCFDEDGATVVWRAELSLWGELAELRRRAANDDAATQALLPLVQQDWSLATALSLLVWFIYAPQCLSTLATIKRETGSWKQTAFATIYLFALAYGASFVTYQIAVAMGAG